MPTFAELLNSSQRKRRTAMPSGGARVNAGRRMTDLRSLNISDVGVAFDEPVEYCAEGLVVTQCGACGAVSWEPYHVRITPIEPVERQSNGEIYEHWPTLATVQMDGRVAKHSRTCPNR